MTMPTYLTIEEADEILSGQNPWTTATDEEKQDAIELSRVYSDANYYSTLDSDILVADVPENVKRASAIIANEQLKSDIFNRQTGLGSLEEKKVKAEGVEVSKKYKVTSNKTWVDPFMKASALFRPQLTLLKGKGMVQVSLGRR